jgi:hypothetical protein
VVTAVTSTAGGQTVTSTAGSQTVSSQVVTSTSSALSLSVSTFASAGISQAASGGTTLFPLATVVENGIGIVNTSGSMVPPSGTYLIFYTTVLHTNGSGNDHNAILKKNGSVVYETGNDNPSITNNTTSWFTYVSANGSDTFTLSANIQYTSGSATGDATITWLSLLVGTPTITSTVTVPTVSVPSVTSSVTVPIVTNTYITVPVLTTQFGAAIF